MKHKLLLCLLLLLCFGSINAKETGYWMQDSLIFEKYVQDFSDQKNEDIGNLVVQTALYLVNKPYVGSTLEKNDREELIVNLREFDCTTFVETSIALSGTIRSGIYSFKNFRELLQSIRYREGMIDGYASRLHYTTDWMINNQRNELFENITPSIGGRSVAKHINFMSAHPQFYKHLKGNAENRKAIQQVETILNTKNDSTSDYIILDKDKIKSVSSTIKNGDIIGFATSIEGLDYSHIAIAYHKGGKLTFIHASSKYKKTCIEPKGLDEYCKDLPNCTGISILRLNN